jgi:hypothetical protein
MPTEPLLEGATRWLRHLDLEITAAVGALSIEWID